MSVLCYSLFLYSNKTRAIFNLSGKTVHLVVKFTSSTRVGKIMAQFSLMARELIKSNPVAFVTSNLLMIDKISEGQTSLNSISVFRGFIKITPNIL